MNDFEKIAGEVKELITKAANSPDSGEAMKFSQAAVNAANAASNLVHTFKALGN